MELRRNPSRRCKEEGLLVAATTTKTEATGIAPRQDVTIERDGNNRHAECSKTSRKIIKSSKLVMDTPQSPRITPTIVPFPFFELPREIRDLVYSYLVILRTSSQQRIIEATSILNNRKKRAAAQAARDRVNKQRISSGKRPICPRSTVMEPLVEVNLLRVSQRIYHEARDYLYTNNWFAISLSKLPSTIVEIPDGWDLSRIKRLQIELQLKDVVRMNSYMDWPTFFTPFSLLRFLRIVSTFHPRYYDWAQAELGDWQTTHYVHKAFFRELLAAIPSHVEISIGPLLDTPSDKNSQGRTFVSATFLNDMYKELSNQRDSTSKRLAADGVAD